MLRARVARRRLRLGALAPSPGLRPFWRRSIQARVVASTVILTAVVIAAVGWLLLQQTRDGLLDQRVEAVTAEVADEVQEQNGRLQSASGQDADASVQRRDLIDLIIQRGTTRGYGVVVAGPAGEGVRIADGGTESSGHFSATSVPVSLERALRGARRPDGLDLHLHRPHRRRGQRGQPRARDRGRRPGARCPPTAAPTRSTSCSRSTSSRTRWGWSPAPCSRRARCCWSWSLGSAGWSPGRS